MLKITIFVAFLASSFYGGFKVYQLYLELIEEPTLPELNLDANWGKGVKHQVDISVNRLVISLANNVRYFHFYSSFIRPLPSLTLSGC